MRTTTKQLLALALVGVMIASAGCAGWGTDGPADNESDGSDTDDLEDEQNQNQSDDSGSDDSDSDSDTSTGDSSTDSDSDSDSSDSDSDRSSSSSDSSDCPTGDCPDQSDDTDDSASGSSDADPQGSSGEDGDADDSSGQDSDDSSDSSDDSDSSDSDSDSSDSDGDSSDDTSDGDSDTDDGSDGDDGTDGDSSDGDSSDEDQIGANLTVNVENQDGEPVEDIEVVGIGPDADIFSTTTNADGQAIYEGLPAGDYEYHATTDGTEYEESSTESIALEDGDEESLTVQVTDTDENDAPETSTLTVNVENHNGEPVENASVSVVTDEGSDEVASGSTDANGQASFDVENGEYHVIVDHEDVTGDAATPVTVDGDTETSLTLDTSEGLATGIVTVVDENGDPVEGEPVTLWPPGTVEEEATETVETDANGEVVIELAAGDPSDVAMYTVEVRDQEESLGIMADAYQGVQEVEFQVDTSENGGEPETHALDVSVTDPNEDPIEGASVSLVTADGGEDVASGATNSDGVATFEVPNGEYEAVVTVEDSDLHQPSDQRLVTVDGSDASLDVQMQDSGDNGNGGEETHTLTLLAESPVTLTAAASGEEVGTKEPTDGAVTFEEIPGGEYTFDAEGYYNGLIFVDSDTELELQDTDGAEMNITVTDAESGDPIEGAEISGECDLWYTGGDSYVETTAASGPDGVVTVQTGVTPTSCDATVTAPGYEDGGVVFNAPAADGRTVELQPVETVTPDPNESGDVNETNGNATAAVAM